MASEVFARGDFLANRGTPLIDSGNDLCPGNVGGQIVPFVFTKSVADTMTGTEMAAAGSTVTEVNPYKAGSIIGMSLAMKTALITDTHASFTVYNGATSTGFVITLNASADQYGTTSQVKDTDSFSANDKLTVQIHSDTMKTSTASVILFLEM